MLVWEWNTNAPVKWIADPSMYSMPSVTVHPSGDYWAGQGLDNTIHIYGVSNNFRATKKKFTGHKIDGYACQIGFSPDGRCVCIVAMFSCSSYHVNAVNSRVVMGIRFTMSGDSDGRLFFWDYRTTKLYRKMKTHADGPCMGAIWHPTEPSGVATCGWDGLVKLWD